MMGGRTRVRMRYAAALAAIFIALARQDATTDPYAPARLADGPSSPLPSQMIAGGGEVLLELSVEPTGLVGRIDRLRVTPPYTDLVTTTVEGWRFTPARIDTKEGRRAVASRVLVAAVYRPPALYLGGTLGEVPRDVARSSIMVPIPHELIAPPYPPTARGSATVLLEREVGSDGGTRNIRVVQSGGGLDPAAIQAAERWRFSPARLPDGPTVPAFVYLVVGFREPTVSPGR
jgi:TonB family protein